MQLNPLGASIVQPPIPARGAPADPNQVGLWKRFQDRLTADPNLRMALLTTGLNMLRTPQPGQNGFDVFANAASTGLNTLDQLRQRDVLLGQQERQEARADRGLDIREEDSQARDLDRDEDRAQRASQFDQRMSQLAAQLTENQRQFDTRNAAGDFSPAGSQTTGQERLIEANIRALQTAMPETYPATDEGAAKARLLVTGIGSAADPEASARMKIQLFSALQEQNTFADNPLGQDQLIQTTEEIFNKFLGGPAAPASGPADAPTDPFDGASISRPTDGAVGRVVKVGEDQYVMEFAEGQTGVVSGAQIRSLLEAQSNGQ